MLERRSAPQGLPPILLALGYVLVVALPLIVAIMVGAGHRQWLMRAAAATGIAAGVMVLLQMVSSGRFEAISGRIGIDVTMAFHKWAAPAALVLALAHVAFLIGPPDPDRPHRLLRRLGLVLTQDGLWDARLALLLLALLILLALFRDGLPFRYEIWRAGHALGALALIVLMLSHILAYGRGGAAAAVVWLAIAAAATLPALWVYARRLWVGSADWTIAASHKVADRLWDVTLNRTSGELDFRAGQFAWVAFGGTRLPLYDHPFSIASAPSEAQVRFLIQEDGDFTSGIGSIPPGTRVGLDAPHGSFGLRAGDAGPVLLIAGGVGIAPVLAVLSDLSRTGPSRPVRLIYAARSPSAMLPADMIAPACERLGIRPILLVDEGAGTGIRRGPLTETHLRQALEGLEPARVQALICGPGPMMTMATDTLARLGVPLPRIAYERFSYATRDISAKDRRVLAGFTAVAAAIAGGIAAYSLG